MARTVRQESEAHGAQQMQAIKDAVNNAKEEGFPEGLEEKEGYFMTQVAQGEGLCTDSMLGLGDFMSVVVRDDPN